MEQYLWSREGYLLRFSFWSHTVALRVVAECPSFLPLIRCNDALGNDAERVLMKKILKKGTTVLGALAVVAMVATGCSSGDNGNTDSGGSVTPEESGRAIVSTLKEGFVRADEGGTPVQGGTFRWAAYAEPKALDPASTIIANSTGGLELLNLFDVLIRWDGTNREFVPQTAESLTPNETFDEWTLKLKDGIVFSDGTAYDANAVKASQERYAGTPTAPEAAPWNQNVEAINVLDDLTIEYKLSGSWSGFPSILSTGPGMIVAAASGSGEEYKPVGAGPFLLDTWIPGEKISFVANENYWDGKPYLDGFESIFLNDQQVGIDSLASGSVDATFALHPNFVAQTAEAGYNGYIALVNAGLGALINAKEGMPGHDIRVRKAMQLAIEPQMLADRAYEGTLTTEVALFPSWSEWATDVPAVTPNQEEAKKLLAEAMADGYDGKIEYIDGADATSRNRSAAIQAQLEAVGFEVTVTGTRTIAERIQRITGDQDYHIIAWGMNIRESDPLPRMLSMMHSGGTQTYFTKTSPEMDSYIEDFQAALTKDDQLAAMAKIQERFNEDIPFLSWGQFAEMLAWSDDVHGIVGSANSTVLLGKAWLDN